MTPFSSSSTTYCVCFGFARTNTKNLFSNCYSCSIIFAILWIYDLDLIQKIQMIFKKIDKFG